MASGLGATLKPTIALVLKMASYEERRSDEWWRHSNGYLCEFWQCKVSTDDEAVDDTMRRIHCGELRRLLQLLGLNLKVAPDDEQHCMPAPVCRYTDKSSAPPGTMPLKWSASTRPLYSSARRRQDMPHRGRNHHARAASAARGLFVPFSMPATEGKQDGGAPSLRPHPRLLVTDGILGVVSFLSEQEVCLCCIWEPFLDGPLFREIEGPADPLCWLACENAKICAVLLGVVDSWCHQPGVSCQHFRRIPNFAPDPLFPNSRPCGRRHHRRHPHRVSAEASQQLERTQRNELLQVTLNGTKLLDIWSVKEALRQLLRLRALRPPLPWFANSCRDSGCASWDGCTETAPATLGLLVARRSRLARCTASQVSVCLGRACTTARVVRICTPIQIHGPDLWRQKSIAVAPKSESSCKKWQNAKM